MDLNIDQFGEILKLLEKRCTDPEALKNLKKEPAWTLLSKGNN